jgi:hypothetical protein
VAVELDARQRTRPGERAGAAGLAGIAIHLAEIAGTVSLDVLLARLLDAITRVWRQSPSPMGRRRCYGQAPIPADFSTVAIHAG